MRVSALEDSYGAATRAGLNIIGVVANACSTPTGTFDPLVEVADFCQVHGLWLHVDAAHGAAALLSKSPAQLAHVRCEESVRANAGGSGMYG